METTEAFSGLSCRSCDGQFEPATGTHRCPACGGLLDPDYDYDAVELSRTALASRPFDSMWRYAALLPFDREVAVTMDEGATALVSSPTLAAELGVEHVYIKDEGRNPTGTFKDRGASLAVTAARQHGATDVALASAGNAGQSVAAYAGRANIDAHIFLPARAAFTTKAMVNVHGADLTVGGGGLREAGEACADARSANDDWYPLSSFHTPYRHEGKKTIYYEVAEQLEWETPDAVVYPTGGGVGLVGMVKAARELQTLGLTDSIPSFYAAQASGCAPIVDAFEAGRSVHDPVTHPDTICGGIEVPDPAGSEWILEALSESNGGAVATEDAEILDAAVTVAHAEGLECAPTAAAAASGAWKLAESGAFDDDATVVIVNTGTGSKEADVLRSHLMSKGI